jgi:hypothetical protein
MKDTGGEAIPGCPYLWPGVPRALDPLPFAVYCRRPGGRIRIPSRDELRRFCVGARHVHCPGYRRVRLRETTATGLA